MALNSSNEGHSMKDHPEAGSYSSHPRITEAAELWVSGDENGIEWVRVRVNVEQILLGITVLYWVLLFLPTL